MSTKAREAFWRVALGNNTKLSNLAKLAIKEAEDEQQPKREHCVWTQSEDPHMPDTWEAACGAVWTFTEGGPKDNDMNHCPKCGKPAIEAAHGII